MTKAEAVKNRIVGKAKRLVGEVLGDQKLHDGGKLQEERQGRQENNEPNDIKPLGNLDQLT
jgi:uncharacterized protein YjbJ (UPF0337 family)